VYVEHDASLGSRRARCDARDAPDPVGGAGEVVVDVAYAGVCRSDLAVIDDRSPSSMVA